MATDASETEAAEAAPDAYRTLLEAYRRVANLRAATRVLSWAQPVMMPARGPPARSQHLSTLSWLSPQLPTYHG